MKYKVTINPFEYESQNESGWEQAVNEAVKLHAKDLGELEVAQWLDITVYRLE